MIRLDHTIIPARDAEASARWFASMFGVAEPVRFSLFEIISVPYGGVDKG
jgi:catechol 2,3-dioxygenase-like lactoylglutathione lyase family enzyme